MAPPQDKKDTGGKGGDEKDAPIKALDATDIAFLKHFGAGPYTAPIKKAEQDLKDILKRVNDVCGVKESDTGLAPPSRWDLVSDKQMMQEEQPLQVRGSPLPAHRAWGAAHARMRAWQGHARRARGAARGCTGQGARCAWGARAPACTLPRGPPARTRPAPAACTLPRAPAPAPTPTHPRAPRRWRAAPKSSTPTRTRPST